MVVAVWHTALVVPSAIFQPSVYRRIVSGGSNWTHPLCSLASFSFVPLPIAGGGRCVLLVQAVFSSVFGSRMRS